MPTIVERPVLGDTLQNENREKILRYARSVGLASIEELLHFPKFIQIETIAACNAVCVMCPVMDISRETRVLSPLLFDRILSELALYADWIERVTIQLNGEPLLDGDLENKIIRLKETGIKHVSFTTNCSLMTAERAESILNSGVDNIDISVDGATRETYESIRGNLSFDEVFGNIRGLIELRNRIKPAVSIRLRMTIWEKNSHEFNLLGEYWKPLMSSQDGVYGKLISSWATWMDGYSLPEGHDPTRLNSSPCVTLWGSFPILADGRVPICCTDFNAKATLGDVKVSSIREIWQGDTASRLRELHMTRGRAAVGICNDCFVWEDTTKVA
jgi:MoaA/NifB/PqqE/SkfB family radical SAM enzyme